MSKGFKRFAVWMQRLRLFFQCFSGKSKGCLVRKRQKGKTRLETMRTGRKKAERGEPAMFSGKKAVQNSREPILSAAPAGSACLQFLFPPGFENDRPLLYLEVIQGNHTVDPIILLLGRN